VYCGTCHDDAQLEFDSGIHGYALKQNLPYAPRCSDCHGVHDILAPSDPASSAYKMRVPFMCGQCHREGAPVAQVYDIPEHNIIDNYSQSIHGEGLFQKGLTVTATCTDCHRSHRVLPHTDPNASVSPRNIARTCMQCHSRIEDVHEQVIRGELWENRPGAIPACTDCHLPHRVRKETVALTISDRDCLECHSKPDVFHVVDGDTLSVTVSKEEVEASVHRNLPCVKCHSDVNPQLDRPCEPSGRVDCASCHAKISDEYYASGHGQGFLQGMENAPYCTSCHGDHAVAAHSDDSSPTYRASVPEFRGSWGRCGRARSRVGRLRRLLDQRPRSGPDREGAHSQRHLHRLPQLAHGAAARG
jgi:nitrate/TMAO reductase-like tetraheme cytochrome c subunit